jgi:hypothetical protein
MNHGDATAVTLLTALSLVPSSHASALLRHTLCNFLMQNPPLPQFLSMKFAFEIKTEPTLHAAVIIAVTFASSGALAMVAVSLDNPSVTIYSVAILAIIIWIAVTWTSP